MLYIAQTSDIRQQLYKSAVRAVSQLLFDLWTGEDIVATVTIRGKTIAGDIIFMVGLERIGINLFKSVSSEPDMNKILSNFEVVITKIDGTMVKRDKFPIPIKITANFFNKVVLKLYEEAIGVAV